MEKEGNDRLESVVTRMALALTDLDALGGNPRFQYKEDLPMLRRLVTEAQRKAEGMMDDASVPSTMENQFVELKRLRSALKTERNRIEPTLHGVGDVLYVMGLCMAYLFAVVEKRNLADDFDETYIAYVSLNASRRVFDVLARRYGWDTLALEPRRE